MATLPAQSPPAQWVEVLVDCGGVQDLYTYESPKELALQPGDILSVPFGTQQVGAIAIRILTQLPISLASQKIRLVEEVVSRGFFPPDYWTVLHQVADHYHTSLMQVIRVALPPGLLGRSQRRIRLKPEAIPAEAHLFLQPAAQKILELLRSQKQGNYSWQYLQRQVMGASRGLRDLIQRQWVESYLEPPTAVKPKQRQAVTLVAHPGDASVSLTPRQSEILEVLKRQGGELWLQELLQLCQVSSSVLKGLEQKGCVTLQPREVLRLESSLAPQSDRPKALTPDQAHALETIQALTSFTQVLLHGVTGSGKTEVYLQAIAPLLQAGKSALVLVPEIGLTPQLTDRFRARFGKHVCVYHSALSEGERYDTWRQMLSATPQVVIGTRSAIFAPLANLGLIVLDEEHDSSFKQDQPMPCYHARTVAQWRAALANCPLILGSATPSLESWVAAGTADLERRAAPHLLVSLPHRVQDRPMPPIEVVDMRQELRQGNRSIFSRSLQEALTELQENQKQGILFIHRRGHSTFVSCRSCGHVMECPHCDVSLTYHQPRSGGYESLRCHYCGYGQTHPETCPVCASPYLKHFGSGTQRVMEELSQQLPELRCLRFDSDTTRAKGSHRALLTRFAAGEANLLVGTQMLTKGIDLPQVTLVGAVSADGLLHLADYRASERAFQTLLQVAGRAGRGEAPGRVILQTYSPQHPVIEAVVRQDYAKFAESELQYREALHYPPYGRLVLLRLSGMDLQTVRQTAEAIAAHLRQHSNPEAGYEVLGPAAAAIGRVARRYRWQILLKGLSDRPSFPPLTELRSYCPMAVSLTIDVDPLNLS
ncbi:MAG: primosomal protein N' [Drouetiella hepatica Uher 2000/2452]|uniref:Replication restart protein PriA n=1 Tax=Drouetiella hepatica Uher 2000/2452 TaxID=904376 RepID=A0A951Q808_9CYAN|nr:primosomal protein N' [Drouetiella hepatica Uher 2000/2452]